MFNLMQNYEIFTHICILQGLRTKEAKTTRKAVDLAKARSAECRDKDLCFVGIKNKRRKNNKKSS